jgi:hypothetical protein
MEHGNNGTIVWVIRNVFGTLTLFQQLPDRFVLVQQQDGMQLPYKKRRCRTNQAESPYKAARAAAGRSEEWPKLLFTEIKP